MVQLVEYTLYLCPITPAMKARAAGLSRLLISDSFGTFKSAELQRFCYEENIQLNYCLIPLTSYNYAMLVLLVS